MNPTIVGTPIRWRDHAAVLWDLDGVLTATAAVHERAWAEVFCGWDFTAADYRTHVDGRPRIDGVRRFFAARGVAMPEGHRDDPATAETVYGYAHRKNEILTALLARDGVEVYPDAHQMVTRCTNWGLPQAVVSSSRNARTVLNAAGLTAAFGAIIDGVTAVELGLAGKPAPDMFLAAATALRVPIAACVVVEDAVAGVRAARAAGVGVVIGVDRTSEEATQRDALIAAGADPVVNDLCEAGV